MRGIINSRRKTVDSMKSFTLSISVDCALFRIWKCRACLEGGWGPVGGSEATIGVGDGRRLSRKLDQAED